MTTMRLRIILILIGLLIFGGGLVQAQDGSGTLIIINYVGAELVLTLDDGSTYTVPGSNVDPAGGRLDLTLPPQQYDYSGQIPGGPGSNGAVTVTAGETVILGVRIDQTEAKVDSAGIVIEEPQDQLVFFAASLTPAAPEAKQGPPPLETFPAGQGALVLVNYIGDALNVDLAGTVYTVPPNGQLQINLPPGEVVYSANAGTSGTNGTVQVAAGQYTGLGFTREFDPGEPDYDPGDPVPTPVPLMMSAFLVDLDESNVAEATATPTPAPASDSAADTTTTTTSTDTLQVTNYIGETVTFTIDNQVYTLEPQATQSLALPGGEYSFTASTPASAANGVVTLSFGTQTRISLAIDFGNNQVAAYIEK